MFVKKPVLSVILLSILAACGGSGSQQDQPVMVSAPTVLRAQVVSGDSTTNFSGNLSQYTIAATSGGFSVTDKTSGTVQNFGSQSRLRFADTGIAFNLDGIPGQAYRLYQAAFNRTPDLGGLGFQINVLDLGFTLLQVSQNFIDSPEFSNTYGALNTTAFVTLLYSNVLRRAPDDGGLAFYVTHLDGTNPDGIKFTRAEVLRGFSESPENKALVLPAIANGIQYTPAGPPPVVSTFPAVQAIVMQRCVPCHSVHPTFGGFSSAPRGITFDTEGEIRAQADLIRSTAVDTLFMPYGNMTQMTAAERDTIRKWLDAGTP